MMLFQLIRVEDGTRTRSLSCSREKLRECIETLVPRQNWEKFLVLVLVEDAQVEEFEFSKMPLLKVSTFMEVTKGDAAHVE